MNLQALLPSGLRVGQDFVGAEALGVLISGIHLDRRNARGIGWRGLRPCMGTGYAWTMRTAGRDGVYGLAFLSEERDAACLRSRFSVFYFPDPDETVLTNYLPAVRRVAAAPDYFAGIREFTIRETSNLFFLGGMGLDLRLDLQGLSFVLETPARQRIVAVDGLPHDGMAESGVEEGGRACDVPTFRLALPFIRLLVLSAASLLETWPQWAMGRTDYPVAAFTADGEWGVMKDETLPGVVLAAGLGEPILPHPGVTAANLRLLTGRAFALKEQTFDDSRPVLHVVSGFLGSGKTTFLSEWLNWLHNHDRHTTVLQNELGEKSLDPALLRHETVSELLDEGCVCCSLADSLRPAVRRLMSVLPTEQIILETTGLANPGAVRDSLDDLTDIIRPGLCISLVDALDWDRLLAEGSAEPSGLAGEQISRADVLICNKADMVPPERVARIMDVLRNMNPGATLFNASFGRIPFGELDRLSEREYRPSAKAAYAFRSQPTRRITHQDEGYSSLALDIAHPLTEEKLAAVVRFAKDNTPRIKGIIDSVEANGPMIVQYAAGVLSMEVPLSPPGPDRFLVFIGKELDAAFAARLSQFFC